MTAAAAAVWLSILWLDRPIALWVKGIFGEWRGPHGLTELIDSPASSTSILPAIAFVLCDPVAVMRRRFSKVETTIALCAMSTLAGIVVKDQLKFVFGWTLPDSWAPNVLSFIHNGVYGFNYFHLESHSSPFRRVTPQLRPLFCRSHAFYSQGCDSFVQSI